MVAVLEDEEKQFVMGLINPAMSALVASIMYRNEMPHTEENSDLVADAVADFICEYYAKG